MIGDRLIINTKFWTYYNCRFERKKRCPKQWKQFYMHKKDQKKRELL